jgi:outer membrane protein W
VGSVKSETAQFSGENVEVTALTPVLLGLRHILFSVHNPSALQPYITLGAGPYWLHDVKVRDRYYEDEVTVKSKVKPGAYAGAGMDFMLASWVGLNFDVKYHFVDFNVNHDYSGFDYGLGFSFMWGRYGKNCRR